MSAGLSRTQWLALAGVMVLLLAAFALRDGGEVAASGSGEVVSADLERLRTEADLDPCPAGLGPALPDLVLTCLGGGPAVELRSAPPGRPTLVNIWATWCGPCQDEMPELVEFAAQAGDRVGLVGVLNVDEEDNGLAFSRDFGVRHPSLVDPDGELYRAYPGGLPTTLFLDADGRVRHVERGEVEDLAELTALVEEHLGVRL